MILSRTCTGMSVYNMPVNEENAHINVSLNLKFRNADLQIFFFDYFIQLKSEKVKVKLLYLIVIIYHTV